MTRLDGEPICRVCGCCDDDCQNCIRRTGEPCSWIAADLCSACVETANMRVALEESVKLQSHYASLLNAHDGGMRVVFRSVDDWLARLRELAEPRRARRRVPATSSTPAPAEFAELIGRSSVGAGLQNIRENGLDAELEDLDRELHDE